MDEVQLDDSSELPSRDSDLEPPSTAFPYATEQGYMPDTTAPRGKTHPQSQQQDRTKGEVQKLIGEVGEPLQELTLPIRDGAITSVKESGLSNRSSSPAATNNSEEQDPVSPEEPLLPDESTQVHDYIRADNQRTTRYKILFKTFAAAAGVIAVVLAIVLIFLGLDFGQVFQCPESHKINSSVAKNSTAILINATELTSALECFEPLVEVSTSLPINLYQSNCNNLSYSPQIINPHISLVYAEATNPLPAVFDENSQNYLSDANITVMVNVSWTSKASSNEFLFICLYDNYYQFQSFLRQSSVDFWQAYEGTECSAHEITHGSNEISNDLYISSPRYVFIGVGSTIEPLDTFQFTLSVNGRAITEPGPQSQIEECVGLGDNHPSCRFKLNITDNSDGLCVIVSRPVDRASKVLFSNLIVKWISGKSLEVQEIVVLSLMSGMVLIGIIVAVVALVAWCCLCRRPFSTSTPFVHGPPALVTEAQRNEE